MGSSIAWLLLTCVDYGVTVKCGPVGTYRTEQQCALALRDESTADRLFRTTRGDCLRTDDRVFQYWRPRP